HGGEAPVCRCRNWFVRTPANRPATLDELAERLQLPVRTLRINADGLVALGVLERAADIYRNSTAAAAFLCGGGPDLRAFLRLLNRLSYPRWSRFEEAIRTDRIIFGESGFTDEQQRLYSTGVESVTAGTAQALATSYDFPSHP